MELTEIYTTLKQRKLCKNAYDFSERYLGKNKNYYSVIKARKRQPSIQALTTLLITLHERIDSLNGENHYVIKAARNDLKQLSQQIQTQIKTRCTT